LINSVQASNIDGSTLLIMWIRALAPATTGAGIFTPRT
jgi:hypothetical protein